MTIFRLRQACAVLGALAVTAGAGSFGTAAASPAGARPESIPLGPDPYVLVTGLGSVWVLAATWSFDYSKLYEIDPRTHALVNTIQLDQSGLGIAVAYGSVWVSMPDADTVERIDPTGNVLARIRVGQQPDYMHAAFGSIWVANHHGASVSRIDPSINKAVKRIPAGTRRMFAGGPQDITSDSRYIYVGASNGNRPLTIIDPQTNTPVKQVDEPNDFMCNELRSIDGMLWSMDGGCSGAVYRLDAATGAQLQEIDYSPGLPTSLTLAGGSVWISYDAHINPHTGVRSHGTLEQRDPVTGDLEHSCEIGGDVSKIASGFGHIWVVDDTHGTVRAIRLDCAAAGSSISLPHE